MPRIATPPPDVRPALRAAVRWGRSPNPRWDHVRDVVDGAWSPGGGSYVRVPDLADDAPVDVCVELTRACVLRCGWCFSDSAPGRDRRFLPADVVEGWLAEHRGSLVRACLSGGEPLMHPEIARLLRLPAGLPGVGFVLNTNGTVRADLDPLLVEHQWLVAMSLHGDRDTHADYTNAVGYDRVVARIRRLASATPVHVYSVLHAGATLGSVESVLDVAAGAGVGMLRFVVPRGGAGRLGSPPSPALVAAVRDLVGGLDWAALKDAPSFSAFLDVDGVTRRSH
ncbi:MAG: radical SAM protein [Kineosporiaceae bacterium]